MRDFRQLPRALWTLYIAVAALRLGAFVYPYLTIYLTRARGFSTADAGWILAGGGVGLVVGNLLGGQLTDRLARKATLLIALAIHALGYAGLLAFEGTGIGQAAWLAVAYVGMGMFTPAAQCVVADLCRPEQRALAYTGFYFSGNLGIALGPVVGGILAEHSFTLVFLGDIATTIACGLLVLIALPRVPVHRVVDGATDSRPGPVGVYRQHPHVVRVCAASFFLIAPLMGLEYAVPLLVENEFLAPLRWVGVVYTVNALTIVLASFPIERAVRGRAEPPLLLVAAALWAIGIGVLVVGWSVTALVLSTMVWTLGEILTSVLVPSYVAAHVAAEVKGRYLALVDLGRSVATVLSPIGLGYLWLWYGPAGAVHAILALPVLGVLAFASILFATRSACTVVSRG